MLPFVWLYVSACFPVGGGLSQHIAVQKTGPILMTEKGRMICLFLWKIGGFDALHHFDAKRC
ncbi:hypothetical protein GCM10027565_32070 [Bordetella tumulicola]